MGDKTTCKKNLKIIVAIVLVGLVVGFIVGFIVCSEFHFLQCKSTEESCADQCYNGGTLLIQETKTCTCAEGYGGQCCECEIQDCEMTPWNDWSECSHACGPLGMTFRTRNVLTSPMCGGIECSRNVSEQKPCNRMCENEGILNYDAGECSCTYGFSGHCCNCENVDCELSNWTEWSTCENATRQVRSRDVGRYPKCAGHACEGSLTEDRSCEIALKHKLLLPKWSVTVVGVFCGLLMLGYVPIVVYCCIRRRRRDSQQ